MKTFFNLIVLFLIALPVSGYSNELDESLRYCSYKQVFSDITLYESFGFSKYFGKDAKVVISSRVYAQKGEWISEPGFSNFISLRVPKQLVGKPVKIDLTTESKIVKNIGTYNSAVNVWDGRDSIIGSRFARPKFINEDNLPTIPEPYNTKFSTIKSWDSTTISEQKVVRKKLLTANAYESVDKIAARVRYSVEETCYKKDPLWDHQLPESPYNGDKILINSLKNSKCNLSIRDFGSVKTFALTPEMFSFGSYEDDGGNVVYGVAAFEPMRIQNSAHRGERISLSIKRNDTSKNLKVELRGFYQIDQLEGDYYRNYDFKKSTVSRLSNFSLALSGSKDRTYLAELVCE